MVDPADPPDPKARPPGLAKRSGLLYAAGRAYLGLAEPLRALALKRARLAECGLAITDPLPVVSVQPSRTSGCAPACTFDPRRREEVLERYVERAVGAGAGPPMAPGRARLTPMAISLARFPSLADFEALIRKRSSRTLTKARAAVRKGYDVRMFPIRRHVEDVHAVKTSMAFRSAGLVLDYWLLRPEHVGRQADRPVRLMPPACPCHWSIWWGAFVKSPGHLQGGVTVDERLVAYIKLVRVGDLVHYADIMGHRDHLDAGVMAAAHLAAMRWLIERRDPATAGTAAVLYGAAEHGRSGLLTWKRRAGFEPTRLVLEGAQVAKPSNFRTF